MASFFNTKHKISKTLLFVTIAGFSIAQALTNPVPPSTPIPKTCDNTESSSMKRTMAPLTRLIPNNKLYVSEPNPAWFGNGANEADNKSWTNGNWLKSRFHFSFAEYNNPRNSQYGILRVMNDDLVQPFRGFGTHPHRNMEIITYIVHGSLTHKDSMGNGEALGRGSIQFMTAGTGVTHSEFNDGDKPLRFIQTWIMPRRAGLAPNYGSYNASKDCDSKKNILQHLASDTEATGVDTPVKIAQDMNCYAAELERGKSTNVTLDKERQAYLLCVEGELEVNGQKMEKYDGMEIQGDEASALEIKATGVEETENGQVAHFLMFDMPLVHGSGRSDF
jgi:redox-sensitive bicupin YhaK (pirin superfamily)